MKLSMIFSLILLSLISQMSFAKSSHSPLGFKLMASDRLNNKLETALKSLKCRVTSSSGVSGVSAEHHKKNPASCHEVGKAIDIAALSCQNNKSNSENLMDLYNKLGGITFLTCYKGRGRCQDSHTGHLHFGAAQWTKCAM